jgi:hypothetical protein
VFGVSGTVKSYREQGEIRNVQVKPRISGCQAFHTGKPAGNNQKPGQCNGYMTPTRLVVLTKDKSAGTVPARMPNIEKSPSQ